MWCDDSQLIDCGIDWFTTTAVDSPTTTLLMLAAEQIASRESRKGNFMKGWKLAGYSGWRVGRLEYGWREDGGIVRLKSDLAASEWWTLFQITGRCSRIDLQATFRCRGFPVLAIMEMGASAAKFWKNREDGPKRTMWRDNEGGATLYLGSRQSELFFRAYNKEAQSGLEHFKGCVRLELEVKGRITVSVINRLLHHDTVQLGVLRCLGRFAAERGITTNLSTEFPGSFYEPSTQEADAVKSLMWLAAQVKPTVCALIELGLESEVKNALGLLEIADR